LEKRNAFVLIKWQKATEPLQETMQAYDLLKGKYEANKDAIPFGGPDPGITTQTEEQMKEIKERLEKREKRKRRG